MKKSVIALAALFAAVGAQAATISGGLYNLTNATGTVVAQTTTELPNPFPNEANGGGIGTLNLFDPLLGGGRILTGVTFYHGAAANFTLTGTSTAAAQVNATINSATDVNWSSTNAGLTAFFATHTPIGLATTTGSQTYNPGQVRTFGPFADDEYHTHNLSAFIADFSVAGGGTFTVSCDTESGFGVQGGGGNVTAGQNTTAGCGSSITYEFRDAPTPMPEPASLALVGLALAGLAAARRRKV